MTETSRLFVAPALLQCIIRMYVYLYFEIWTFAESDNTYAIVYRLLFIIIKRVRQNTVKNNYKNNIRSRNESSETKLYFFFSTSKRPVTRSDFVKHNRTIRINGLRATRNLSILTLASIPTLRNTVATVGKTVERRKRRWAVS